MRSILRQGLKRLQKNKPARPLGNRTASVIAVSARKGGVGKTTTTVNLGAALARFHGLKTLLIDLDPQAHVGRSLSAQFRPKDRGVSAFFGEDSDVDLIDLVVPTDVEHLHIIAPDDGLNEVEALLTARLGKEFVLREGLEVARSHYDVILIDCPPNLGNLTINALVATDLVLIPCDLSPLAVDGVHSLVDTIATISQRMNPSVDVLGVLVTRFDGRNTGMNDAVVEALRDAYGDVVIPHFIGVNTDLAKAQLAGQDVFDFAPSSRGAQHHRQLAEFVAQQLAS